MMTQKSPANGTTLDDINILSESDNDDQASHRIAISNELMFYINIYLYFLACGIMAIFGMANNIINMTIFHDLGLNSSMSVGLMALSLTDFLVSFFSVMRIGLFMWDLLQPYSHLNPTAVNQVTIAWWIDILFLCSAWFTAFLSIERCVCVVFPFKVKNIFTKSRSILVVILIYLVNIGAHVPVFASQWLERTKVPTGESDTGSNTTTFQDRLVIKYSSNFHQVQLYIDVTNGAVLPIPSQALVLFSVIWMIHGLHTSSRIRKTNVLDSSSEENTQKKNASNLSSKERKLVKVVLLLAIILTFCNTPRFIAVYAKQIFPQVTFSNSHRNLYMLLWTLANVSSVVNASVNIFVYLIINVNYRRKFKELFCTSFGTAE